MAVLNCDIQFYTQFLLLQQQTGIVHGSYVTAFTPVYQQEAMQPPPLAAQQQQQISSQQSQTQQLYIATTYQQSSVLPVLLQQSTNQQVMMKAPMFIESFEQFQLGDNTDLKMF
jgi:hypothetical protein